MKDHNKFLAALAQDYYLLDMSIGDIANKYQISRYLVNKYLSDAKAEKIVTIKISQQLERQIDLENKFHELFDIENIYIIKDSDLVNRENETLLNFSANRVLQYIKNSHIVGTVWGGTIYDIIERLPKEKIENLLFTQFVGENRKYNSQAGSMRMVQKIADKFSATYTTLSGPLYILNNEVRLGMLSDIASLEAMSAASHMDFIFCGLGTIDSVKSIPIWNEYFRQIFPKINSGDIAGMAYGRPYDINGNFLNPSHDFTFGIDLQTILNVPHRLCVVKSKFKSHATLGALRGKFFTELIITESVARKVLSEI